MTKVSNEIDFLIIGHGIAGALLADSLSRSGKRICVVSDPKKPSASRVAAGLLNPLTGGWKFHKTWEADLFFPFAHRFYPTLEQRLNARFFYPKALFRPFPHEKEARRWVRRSTLPEYENWVQYVQPEDSAFSHIARAPLGGLALHFGGFVDLPTLLDASWQSLKQAGTAKEASFRDEDLQHDQKGVQWKNIRAQAVIFCRGAADAESTFFKAQPFAPVKGEILRLKPEKEFDFILNKAAWVFRHAHGEFVAGSTYEHEKLDTTPTAEGRETVENKLHRSLHHTDWEITGQVAGIRPATVTRKPLMGKHPKHERLFLFNGLGSKGSSVGPYLAEKFAAFLCTGENIALSDSFQFFG